MNVWHPKKMLSRMGVYPVISCRVGCHTGLVPFVDDLGTVCGEVPQLVEYGFEVLV